MRRTWAAAVFLVMVVPQLTGAQEKEKPKAEEAPPPSYCGVQALARALRAYGKEVRFADLLKPEYISSGKGSSAADLLRAAGDFGLQAHIRNRLNWFLLENSDCAAILHVKTRIPSSSYNHWILFVGCRDSQPIVYDGTGDVKQISWEELGAQWDGLGILLSDDENEVYWTSLSYASAFLFVAGLVVSALALLLYFFDRCRWAQGKRRPFMVIAGQAAFLFVFALFLLIGVRLLSKTGFLSSADAVAKIQEEAELTFLPNVNARQLEYLIREGKALVLDSRPPFSFKEGHIPTSLNIPYYYSSEKVESILGQTQTDLLIVYSEQYGCHYSKVLAQTLRKLGYQNVLYFKEGWKGWQRHSRGTS